MIYISSSLSTSMLPSKVTESDVAWTSLYSANFPALGGKLIRTMGLLNFAYQAIQDMWDNWPDEEVLKHGSTNSVNAVVS